MTHFDLTSRINWDNKKSIDLLLVEDVEDDYLITSRFLNKIKFIDIKTTWCQRSSDAIEQCKKNHFDIIILDYQIDELTGIELAKQMNTLTYSNETMLSTPSIILTNVEEQDVAIEAMHVGIDDFVAKSHLSSACLERALLNVLSKHYLHEKVSQKTLKLEAMNQRLEQANLALEQANTQLLRKNDEIGKFYQTVSHELKTPLTSVKEFISIILDGIAGPISADQQEYLSIAHSGCKQMVMYINDLLDVTRLDNHKFSLEMKIQSVEDIVQQTVALMAPKLQQKNISVKINIDSNLPCCKLDADRIKQVIMNIVSNAVKFTDEGGNLFMDCFFKDDHLTLSIRDTGKGIKPEDLPHVFERLYQVEDGDRSSQHGLGLGLYISQEIIKLHEGNIAVESEYGKGTTFNICLPVPNYTELKVANA